MGCVEFWFGGCVKVVLVVVNQGGCVRFCYGGF